MINSFLRAVATVCVVLGASSVCASDVAEPATTPEGAAQVFQPPDFVPSGGDFYPKSAARALRQGVVGIEFQIDAQGRVTNLQQTYTDHPDFSENAKAFLKSGRFRVSEDWGPPGAPESWFVVEVQFSVSRDGAACEEKPPRVADTEALVVCKRLVSRRGRGLN